MPIRVSAPGVKYLDSPENYLEHVDNGEDWKLKLRCLALMRTSTFISENLNPMDLLYAKVDDVTALSGDAFSDSIHLLGRV